MADCERVLDFRLVHGCKLMTLPWSSYRYTGVKPGWAACRAVGKLCIHVEDILSVHLRAFLLSVAEAQRGNRCVRSRNGAPEHSKPRHSERLETPAADLLRT